MKENMIKPPKILDHKENTAFTRPLPTVKADVFLSRRKVYTFLAGKKKPVTRSNGLASDFISNYTGLPSKRKADFSHWSVISRTLEQYLSAACILHCQADYSAAQLGFLCFV
ncbi:MAG: hypothetical protein N2491_10435 [Negativicutes bacterium]|nr:hypothetical protein [Negativicutes bacterium]